MLVVAMDCLATLAPEGVVKRVLVRSGMSMLRLWGGLHQSAMLDISQMTFQ